jgi:phosphatidate cytidylyltransferase
MFRTRLISGIVLVILALVFVISGGSVLWALCLALSLIGLFELYRVFGMERKLIGYVGGILATLYYALLLCTMRFDLAVDWTLYVILVLMAFLFVMVCAYPRYHSADIAKAVFGIFYVPVMFSFLYRTRELPHGTYTVWLIFLSSWGCDTCAYCAGKLFGKHKMSPVLSPKKSVEGAIGGVAGTMILTFIYGTVFAGQMQLDGGKTVILALISGVGALLSMVGDLSASAIKRNYDIKDYGRLIPGHGGILDRFDSMLFTAPVIYFLAVYFL